MAMLIIQELFYLKFSKKFKLLTAKIRDWQQIHAISYLDKTGIGFQFYLNMGKI
jgi:hypothetical protein